MSISLPILPYPFEALEPHISANTLSFHYGKHHQAYVDNLNKLIQGTLLENQSLENIIQASSQDPNMASIFNNAAQVWNHTFYWHSMKPQGGGMPQGNLADQLSKNFGSYNTFKEEFKKAATSQFGSGWAWLIEEEGQLKVIKTGNADLPIIHGQKALMTCDVWEHAYYLDYQNRRPDYIDTFLSYLINWEFVENNLNN